MKKSMVLIVILLMALVLVGCKSTTPTPEPPTQAPIPPTSIPAIPTQTTPPDTSWQTIQQSGVLRVGTTADYPPFEYFDGNYQLTGFDIALIQAIGQRLGLKVEIGSYAWDSLPATVAIGQVDVAISAISVTPERQEIANFSNVYYTSSDAVLSRPDADPNKVKDPESLAAVRLGVQQNSIYETYAQQNLIDTGKMPKQNLLVYIDSYTAVNDLKNERLDAVWMDLTSAQSFVNAGGVKILVQDMNQQLYAIGMMKGADTLRDKINETLTQLNNDGTLANLQMQYLGLKPDQVVTPQPPPTVVPQPTPTPGGCSNNSKWVKDLSYDDKNHTDPPTLKPGEAFTKGWQLKNNGSCTWKTGYVLAYSYGNVSAAQMGGQPIPVTKDVKSGESYDFQVNLIAPVVPGHYIGYWDMRDPQNKKFGMTIWVDIIVKSNTTPTPPPTQAPVPNVEFSANPTTVLAGQAVYFEWKTQNVKTVYFYHDGQKWTEQQVALNGTSTEYPPYSMNYYLHADQMNGATIERKIYITVNPVEDAPNIEYITSNPPQITLGESTRIDWSIKGNVTNVTFSIDNNVVLPEAPVVGNYSDAPQSVGTHVYTIQATGPGGTNTQQTSVNVIEAPPTPPPVTPTTEPQPTPEPPVIQGYDVSPTTIEQGGCVTISWTSGGGTTQVELSRDSNVIYTGGELNYSVTDCELPEGPAMVQYTLKAYNNDGQFDARDATVQVSQAPPQNLLADTNWKLQNMQGGTEVPQDILITAYFSPDGSLSGNGGCNVYNSSYIADGQVITIYPPSSAKMTCGDPADTLELTYFDLLPQVANFEIRDGMLIMLNNGGEEILRFLPNG